PIQTALELIRLRAGGTPPGEHQVLERQVTHLVRLVADLLDVSRISRGRVELGCRPLDLNDIIEGALAMVWARGSARAHSVHVSVEPDVVVFGDSVRLAQVVANLLSNAIKYTERGGNIWVEGRIEGGEALISVRDDGMGIGPETLNKVFELF